MCMWIKVLVKLLFQLTLVTCLGALLCLPAHAGIKTWATLTPQQQEALAPINQQWDTLPEKQQKRLLATTTRFQKLSAANKQLFQNRLKEWVKLTPEQRDRAREKFKAFNKLPHDKREEVKRMVLQKEAEKITSEIEYAPSYKDETYPVEISK